VIRGAEEYTPSSTNDVKHKPQNHSILIWGAMVKKRVTIGGRGDLLGSTKKSYFKKEATIGGGMSVRTTVSVAKRVPLIGERTIGWLVTLQNIS